MKIAKILSLILLAISVFLSADLLLNFLAATVPSMNDGITCRSILYELFDNNWTLERFYSAFSISLKISVAIFIENIALFIYEASKKRNVTYSVVNYGGSQTTFNTDLKSNVEDRQPMIIHMSNPTSSTANWPYYTLGHFCICSGLLTWEDNNYFMGDPYYFSSYISSATANDGEHKKTWTQLNTVITNKFGSGSQLYLT